VALPAGVAAVNTRSFDRTRSNPTGESAAAAGVRLTHVTSPSSCAAVPTADRGASGVPSGGAVAYRATVCTPDAKRPSRVQLQTTDPSVAAHASTLSSVEPAPMLQRHTARPSTTHATSCTLDARTFADTVTGAALT
jgi:hypothetical protein